MSDPTELAALTDYDRKLIEAFQAYQAHGSESAAARAIGLNRTTMTNRLLRFFLRGLDGSLPMDVMPGHIIKSVSSQFDENGELKSQFIKTGLASSDEPFEVPEGHRVKGESALVDPQGRVIQKWVKTAEGERSDDVIEKAAQHAAEVASQGRDLEPVQIDPYAADHLDPDLLNLHLLPDLHIGLHAHPATAQLRWTLPRAVETYRRLFRLLIERSAPAGTGVILGGGDLLHVDDPLKATRGHGNRLDAAEPYEIILGEAEALLVYQVDLALQKYETVVVRILKGNHDPDSAVAIAHFLRAWFRNDPRVTVDTDPSLFWFYEWGVTMLGATHGHETKIKQMPGVMAADRSEMWGRTKVRYAHGFHIHHNSAGAGEEGGASWQTHEAPTPRDDWHQGNPYRARRSLPLITYHRDHGEVATTRETLI